MSKHVRVLPLAAMLALTSRAGAADPAPPSPSAIATHEEPASSRGGEEPRGFTIGATPAWFLTGGVTSGGTIVAHERGGYVGGEVSFVRLNEGRFVGLYGDLYADLGAHRSYATSGVELGYKFFGIDGGAATRFGGDRVELGPTGRVFLTVGILSIYGRYAYFPDAIASGNEHVVQIGGLFKLPFAAWGGR